MITSFLVNNLSLGFDLIIAAFALSFMCGVIANLTGLGAGLGRSEDDDSPSSNQGLGLNSSMLSFAGMSNAMSLGDAYSLSWKKQSLMNQRVARR